MSDFPPGTTIGPYVVDAAIGSGATAQVYRARRASDGLAVALKVVGSAEEDARRRFAGEVAALRRVSHPGVVEVVDAGEHQGRAWLAMELVQGMPLDDWIGRLAGNTRLRHVLLAGVEVAEALAAVHDQHLLHRDLKPANILVLPDGRVKLVDFGFAGSVDRPDDSGTAGTLRYMAPERLAGTVTDQRADLFSLGVVLFELLARRPPHVGGDRNRLVLAQCTEPAPSVAEFAPEVPQAAAALIDQVLAKPVDERPRSAREVAQALRAALDEGPRQVRWRPALRGNRFVGHKSLLLDLVQRAQSGQPHTVLLHGPRDVGLSRILQEVQGRLLVKGGQTVLVSGGPRLLFRVLDGLAGALRPADLRRALLGRDRDLLLAAWPDLGRPTEDVVSLSRPPTPRDLAEAVRGVLARAAERGPLAVLIDDADQADPRDLALLSGCGLLLLASHEPARLGQPADRILVPPLDRAQLSTLAATMLGPATGPRLAMEHAEQVAGLPGRLVAVARGERHPARLDALAADDHRARLRPWHSAVEQAEAAIVERSPDEALQVLAEAMSVPPSPDLEHRAALVRSRAALQRGEVEKAREHARTAARLAPTAVDRSEAHLAHARASLRAEDLEAVIDRGRQASLAADRLGEPGLALRWQVLTARACLRAGGLAAADAVLGPAPAAEPSADPAAVLGLAWTRAELAIHRCDWPLARTHLLLAREQVRDGQGRRVRAGLRAAVGHLWLRRGEVDKAVDQLERAHQDLALTQDAEALAQVLAHLAEGRLLGGEVDEAGRLAADAVRTAEQARSAFASYEAMRVALRQARVAGDLGRIGELCERGQDLLMRRPTDPWGAASAAQLALGRAELGDDTGSDRWLRVALELAPEDPFHRQSVRLARLALGARRRELDPAAAAKVVQSSKHLGLEHLARLSAAFMLRWTGSAQGDPVGTLIKQARASGDRYAASWLAIASEADPTAIRKARGLGFLAMVEDRPLPA
ncbi:protein kinase [Myxococcota bacterium]|nr:protein kinase [Myxococcota bacterium]